MDLRQRLDRYGDAVLAVVLTAAVTLELLAWADERVMTSLAASWLATLPLALRRRTPLASYLLVMVGLEILSGLQPGFDNASFVFVATYFTALYSLGRHARGLEGWLGAVGLVAAMLLFVEGDGGFAQADLGDVGFILVFVGAPWAVGLALRLRRERETALGAENERLRLEHAQAAARAVAEERSRIARELHDVVAHAISVTVLQARGARRALDADPDAVRRALDAIEQTNAAALGDMRRLLAVLRDTEPDGMDPDDAERAPQPSLAHLDRLVDHVRDSGVPVTVEVAGAPRELPPGVDLSAYRIVQEALTNVLKHAADARATVRLDYSEDDLVVTVTDDGIPGPLDDTTGGHGLIGIRERVSVVGGEVDAIAGPEGGFRVRARLPYALELA